MAVMYGYGGMAWGWMFVVVLLLVVLDAAVVAILVVLSRSNDRVSAPPASLDSPASGGSRAHAILDERLARGEIDAAEHRARRAALDG